MSRPKGVDKDGNFGADFVGHKGIDDLKMVEPYYGEWHTFFPSRYAETEEDYLRDIPAYEAKTKWWNELYLNYLYDSGEYGEEYRIHLKMKYNPLFDDPPANRNMHKGPLESYRMIFLDNNSI